MLKHVIKSNNILFEICDNYVKQTQRNRMSIYTANGRLDLTIPVKFSSSKREKFKDIKICYETNWQKNHLKSIQIAYRNSPYYNFFEENLLEIFNQREKFLIDFNIKSIRIIHQILEINLKYNLTKEFKKKYENHKDLRELLNFNSTKIKGKKYCQVFNEKHGFIENLSSLDLIFNKGLNTIDFLNN